jgi:hypothetical protein
VQWNATHVRLIDPFSGQLLREHLRQQRGRHRIQEQDRPTRTPLSTEQLLRRAEIAGTHIGALCRAMHQNLGEEAVRRILGVLNLTKKYGVAYRGQVTCARLQRAMPALSEPRLPAAHKWSAPARPRSGP